MGETLKIRTDAEYLDGSIIEALNPADYLTSGAMTNAFARPVFADRHTDNPYNAFVALLQDYQSGNNDAFADEPGLLEAARSEAKERYDRTVADAVKLHPQDERMQAMYVAVDFPFFEDSKERHEALAITYIEDRDGKKDFTDEWRAKFSEKYRKSVDDVLKVA